MTFAIALTLLSAAPGLQLQPRETHAADSVVASFPAVIVGRVLTPDHRPAAGAVVVSSTGVQGTAAADGRFELAVDVPLEAECVEVSALLQDRRGRGSLVASARCTSSGSGAALLAGSLVLAREACGPTWLPTSGPRNGVETEAYALAAFDDGSGLALYVAAGNVRRWDGSRWENLEGSEYSYAFAVFDDGSGPALYAGGPDEVARWTGSDWSPLGQGSGLGIVRALAVFDDGNGPALYAGGDYGGHVARWNGSSWSMLANGPSTPHGLSVFVRAMAVHDDGSGPALYVGGAFWNAGGAHAGNIARWNGTSWSSLATGVGSVDSEVYALSVFDDGNGPALYAGGDFTTASGTDANRVARWDGSSWSALGSGLSNGVRALTTIDDGGGSALVAGGYFTSAGGGSANRLARWDGSSWTAFGGGLTGQTNGVANVRSCAVFDDGSGPALIVGGHFKAAGAALVSDIAAWDGSDWRALGDGLDGRVFATAACDLGGGPALFAGGNFTSAGGVESSQIARWENGSFSSLGSGASDDVLALCEFDDGSGPALYAGGAFALAGGVSASCIARWDGASWTALGSGLNNSVLAPAVFDAGSGPELYAGGTFTTAGGASANRIARWNGSTWAPLRIGTNGPVHALAVFDDGTGPALYVGGNFTGAGFGAASRVARWDGSNWSSLGGGTNDDVLALGVFDDGSGPALYAGGTFTSAGGGTANHIARWDGSSWTDLGGVSGGGETSVRALAAFDDGLGPRLFVGGNFTVAGGVAARRIARWNGASWSALGGGVDGWVEDLAVHDDGAGPALFVGGRFIGSPAGDSHLAKWGCAALVRQMRR